MESWLPTREKQRRKVAALSVKKKGAYTGRKRKSERRRKGAAQGTRRERSGSEGEGTRRNSALRILSINVRGLGTTHKHDLFLHELNENLDYDFVSYKKRIFPVNLKLI